MSCSHCGKPITGKNWAVVGKDYHDGCLIEFLLDRNEKIETALLNVLKHVETSSPTGYEMSGVWNIANRALRLEGKDEQQDLDTKGNRDF